MLRELLGLAKPEADDALWQKCAPRILPVRLTDGGWSMPHGQLWRRKGPEGWEYRQDAETDDEFNSRSI